jgi:hypothetical protein
MADAATEIDLDSVIDRLLEGELSSDSPQSAIWSGRHKSLHDAQDGLHATPLWCFFISGRGLRGTPRHAAFFCHLTSAKKIRLLVRKRKFAARNVTFSKT